ncbi:methionyl-tRNA formyltransferase [Marinomonas ushuaiensis DSM 15871]|uniref:Methionyl-tRNA formyltransferase n=1 Tax=Marinomonas ushuaiensis DSM 15871 TaxID=1122207 RepID=X7EAE7_9GAMM|nr:methionyl-tRNA formyltransferase [Marinomonas ushuaiensis]ETX12191.1 methionyl-tRNA formyltransferase [Marinomonas ushuaiensis DSM 15871]
MQTSPLRIVFAGTPEFAAASLQAIIEKQSINHYDIVGVYTQPDRPAGRGQKLVQSPVKQLAIANDIPVFQPLNFKQEEDKAQLAELNADLMVVAAYGIILPKVVLDTPKLGCINVHASLLPRWRGAAPINRALIAGDLETGITIMQMDVGLDTGDMLLKHQCDITPTDTFATLHDRLATIGGEALIESLEYLKEGTLTPEEQDESQTCYAAKLTKLEGEVNWSKSAVEIEKQIRGLSPWPGSYTNSLSGVMKIHAIGLSSVSDESTSPGEIIVVNKDGIVVATGQGSILITDIQFAGGKRMKVQDALNGKHKSALKIGQRLGVSENESENKSEQAS